MVLRNKNSLSVLLFHSHTKEVTLKSSRVKILHDMYGCLRSKADISSAHSGQGNEAVKSMTNTFDFPLMSVSTLCLHSSSRSSLTQTTRSALLYKTKYISMNNLPAEATAWRTLEPCPTCPPYRQIKHQHTHQALGVFLVKFQESEDYSK